MQKLNIPLRNPITVKYINGVVSRNPSRVRVQRPAKAGIFKKTGGHPDIFGPHHDCLACGGTGCGHCS